MATTTPHPIPLLYRIMHTYLEPIFIVGGIFQTYLTPSSLLEMTHPSLRYNSAQHHSLCTQIAGAWSVLAFNTIVILRCTRDVTMWKLILTAGLISDVFYTLSLAEDPMGAKFANVKGWSGVEWLVVLTTWPPLISKVLLLMGVGLGSGGKVKRG